MNRFLEHKYAERNFKLVVMGDAGVGKTTAIKGYIVSSIQNKSYDEDCIPSLASSKVISKSEHYTYQAQHMQIFSHFI